jgi:hypothetical protein
LEGGFSKIQLHKDGSAGHGSIAVTSRFKNTIITYAGYTGASLAAIGLFYLVSKQNYHMILYLFIGVLVVTVVFWIRNFFGIVWALTFAGALAVPLYFRFDLVVMHLSIFLASFILVQSILNGLQLCKQSLLERKNPTKSGLMARVRIIPALMFGGILLGQSVYTGYFIVKNIL